MARQQGWPALSGALAPACVFADYFDGHNAAAHRVSVWMADGMLQMAGRDVIRQVPLAQVQWSRPDESTTRLIWLDDGCIVQSLNAADWDAWLARQALAAPKPSSPSGLGKPWAAMATTLLLGLAACACWWGLPLAARTLSH
jgi:hypothetical protein